MGLIAKLRDKHVLIYPSIVIADRIAQHVGDLRLLHHHDSGAISDAVGPLCGMVLQWRRHTCRVDVVLSTE